jgi:hypothetical protein
MNTIWYISVKLIIKLDLENLQSFQLQQKIQTLVDL